MFKEILFLLTLPSIFFFAGFYFLFRFKSFKLLSDLEKVIISLVVSVSLSTSGFILVGLSPLSFRLVSRIFYWSNLLGLIFLFILQRKRILIHFRALLRKTKELFSGDLFDLLFISLLIVFIAKITLFLLLKPIVDADVVNFYLPIARTIYLSDQIPLFNLYNDTPIFFPPPGISVFYALSYSLADSVFSESFRLFPLPFILGTVGTLYLIAKEFFGKKGAKLTTIIFLFLPFWDEFGMAGIFYPDVVFLFLSSFFFYSLFKIFEKREIKGLIFWEATAALALGGALLFKFQGIFLYYFLFLFGLRNFTIFRKRLTLILSFLAVTPFLIDTSKIGIGFFIHPAPLVSLVIIFILFVTSCVFFDQHKSKNWQDLKTIIFIFLISLLAGSIWFLRNYLVFGNPFSLVTEERVFIWKILNQIFPRALYQPIWAEWTLFFIPSLASFWLIPKVLFFLKAPGERKLIFPLIWIVGWFSLWLFYLDGGSDRHLIAIFPFVPLMVFAGINWLGTKIFSRIKAFYFSIMVAILGFLFSLSQSLFLWWNWGVSFYGNETLHRIVGRELLGETEKSLGTSLISPLHKILILLNGHGDIFLQQIPSLGILSFILSSFIVLVAIRGIGLAHLMVKFRKEVVLIVCSFMFLPYIFTFYTISDGNLFQFGEREKEKVYNYWGLTQTVVPYLKKNASGQEAVAYFGKTKTGLSYFTNLKVYELLDENLGGFFRPIFYEQDLEKIYLFFREKGISYFVVEQNPKSEVALDKFKTSTKIPLVLEDKRYFEQQIFPDNNNRWALYKIK